MKKSNKTRMCRVGIFLIGLINGSCPGIWKETENKGVPYWCQSDKDCEKYGKEWYCDTDENSCQCDETDTICYYRNTDDSDDTNTISQ